MKMILTVIVLVLAGCGTDPAIISRMIDINEKQQGISTFEITCPPAGCQFANLRYTDPRDRAQLKLPTNGYDAMIAVGQQAKELVSGTIPVFGMYKLGTSIANKGFDTASEGLKMKSGDVNTSTTTNNTYNANQANTSNTNTMTGSTGVLGTGTYSTTSTSAVGTGVLGSGTYTTTDRHDSYTAIPTVVNPLVVNPVVVVP